jgi:hypothetical protein
MPDYFVNAAQRKKPIRFTRRHEIYELLKRQKINIPGAPCPGTRRFFHAILRSNPRQDFR